MPKLEELVRILFWIIGAALTGSGWANAPVWLDMLTNEALIGAVVIIVAAVWRGVRKLEPVTE